MDSATIALLRQNVSAWCTRNAALLDAMESHDWAPGMAERLFAELDGLGVLHMLHDESLHGAVGMVAETAECLARFSPSAALLLVQQNMAAYLLAEAGAPAPAGWTALPLYDGAAEWRYQISDEMHDAGMKLEGEWGLLPALPIAAQVLLPVEAGATFALVRLDARQLPAGIALGGAVLTLGLRGCPAGDLRAAAAVLPATAIIASGPAVRSAMETLWSQAEVCMLAIRAAILERSYAAAHDYATTRWQGGKTIIEHSQVRRMLGEMHLAQCGCAERLRMLAAALAPGTPLTDGQLALLLESAGEAPKVASDGIQLLGGNGYMEDYGQERRFRDAKQCEMLLGRPHAKRIAAWQAAQ